MGRLAEGCSKDAHLLRPPLFVGASLARFLKVLDAVPEASQARRSIAAFSSEPCRTDLVGRPIVMKETVSFYYTTRTAAAARADYYCSLAAAAAKEEEEGAVSSEEEKEEQRC